MFLLPILISLFTVNILTETCPEDIYSYFENDENVGIVPKCVEPPSVWISKGAIQDSVTIKMKNKHYTLNNTALICGRTIAEILGEYKPDHYYEPNVIVQAIIAALNYKLNGACITPKSRDAIANLLDELIHGNVYIDNKLTACNNFEKYQKELNAASMPKALSRTLYLYNNGQNYGPVKCNSI